MIAANARVSLQRIPLKFIQVTKADIRFPETLNGYIQALITHPECDPEPLHVSPSRTHEGLYALENGYHRFCAAIMTGRTTVLCIVEEEVKSA